MTTRLLCNAFASLPLVLALPAQDAELPGWPCWRGPERDGISRESAWSPRGVVAWRAEVGMGYSSVSIAGGRLFTLGHDAATEEERVLCLDAETGELLWEHRYPEPTAATFHGGGANSTPVVAAGVVYVAGRNGRCLALDAATGNVRWDRDFQEAHELPEAMYGYSASPVVLGNDVVLSLGRTLFAVAATDGEVRWSAKIGEADGFATPHPFLREGKPALASLSGDAFVVVDATNGAELFRYPWKGDQGSVNAASPIVAGDDVFLSSAYGVGAARIRLGEEREPSLVWHSRRMRNKVSGCTLHAGYVYGFDESMLACVSFEDGAEAWRVRGLGMGAVAVAGDRLLVLTSSGELIVAEATHEEFRELSRTKALEGGVYWTTPVLLDGRIFCRNSLGSLVCLDHRPRAASALAQAGTEPSGGIGAPPRIEILLTDHAEKIGGARLAERTSLRLEGKYESTEAGITRTDVTIDWMAPDKWRIEWQIEGLGSAQRGYDGEHGWQADPFYGTFLYEGDALREVADTERLHASLERLSKADSFGAVSPARFDERDCWSVEETAASGARRTWYFDARTGLLAGRDAEEEAMVAYDDYRDFDGVLLPARVRTLLPDTGVEETVWVERATWDTLDASRFLPPPTIASKLRSPEEKAADETRLTEAHGHLFGTYAAAPHPEHAFGVEDGGLVVKVGAQSMAIAEPDADGRFHLKELPVMYCVFTLDEKGRGKTLTFEGFPGEEPTVLERVE